MRFTVHGIPGSPYVRSALLVLEEKGADWRLAAIGFGENRQMPYLARQPFGRIPAFEHDGFALYETQAFLRYVDRVIAAPALQPADAQRLARMDQLLNITDCYVASRVSGALAFPRLVAPRLGIPVDEAALAAAIPDAEVAVGEVARLLGDQEYLTGDSPSLADFHLIAQLGFLPQFAEGLALLALHPRLAGWIERMAARPSMARTSWERLLADTGMSIPAMPEAAVA